MAAIQKGKLIGRAGGVKQHKQCDFSFLLCFQGVLRLLPGFDADNGRPTANGTSPGNLPPQPRPISTELFTTTTARIITATTTATAAAGATTTTNAVETSTEVTTEIPQSTPNIL